MTSSGLSSDMLLRRAAPLSVRLGADDTATIGLPDGREVRCASPVLSVLEIFEKPLTLADAAGALSDRSGGAVGFMDLTSTLLGLVRDGVLVSDGTDAGSAVEGYEDPSIHVAMLADTLRTQAFLAAIRRTVTANDIVIDIGTGSGVLATAAAQAGARHVYAIEASGIANVAQEVFERNGVADRVTLVRGWSTAIELPERATILVSEMIGHEALGERVLEVTLDARKRLLTPDARLIPRAVRLAAIPVKLPDGLRARFAPDQASLDRWVDDYGIDFSPLRAAAWRAEVSQRSVRASTAATWEALSAPAYLATVDLATIEGLEVRGDATVEVTRAGSIDAVVLFWELELDADTTITTEPTKAGDTHWRTPVSYLFEPTEVAPGDRVSVAYRYRVAGARDGVSIRKA